MLQERRRDKNKEKKQEQLSGFLLTDLWNRHEAHLLEYLLPAYFLLTQSHLQTQMLKGDRVMNF